MLSLQTDQYNHRKSRDYWPGFFDVEGHGASGGVSGVRLDDAASPSAKRMK